MHLLYPIGLFALAGLLIPLVIHLWKLKQGKTLRIGSIALLGASAPFTSRSYQITDWLLLFLRLLLIALLAFFLAEPYLLRTNEGKGGQKGWVLVGKENLPIVYKIQKHQIDSLLLSGYELHDFGLGFQKMSLKDTVSGEPEIKSIEHRIKAPKISDFALLRELNARIDPNFPVLLYADYRLRNLGGALPQIDFRLIWKEIKGADTLDTWKETFAHKTFEARSSPALTSVKRLDGVNEESSIRVLIYALDHPEDVKYLNAAIQAIAEESKRNVEVNIFNDQNSSDLKFDVGFWISAKPVSSPFLNRLNKGGRLFSYASEKLSTMNSWLEFDPGSRGNLKMIGLTKRTTASDYPGLQIWTDGYGIPLLTLAKENTIDHFRFYSRMNPTWTDLVWNAQFVELMMPILLGQDNSASGFGFKMASNDQRIIPAFATPSSAQFSKDASAGAVSTTIYDQNSGMRKPANTTTALPGSGTVPELSSGFQNQQPLQKAFWLVALLVFTLERLLSFRYKNKINHG